MAGLLDFLQSASNTAADTVAAPVDLLAWTLRKAGVPVPQSAIGGTRWMTERGLRRDVQQSPASLAGETVGLLSPMVAAAKAPQIAKGLLQVEANAAAPKTLRPEAGAIVWHGSPHKFDRFDSSKIGTGEGAQAYGHGLYLAESPSTAEFYKGSLTDRFPAKLDGRPAAELSTAQRSALGILNDYGGNVDSALAFAKRDMQKAGNVGAEFHVDRYNTLLDIKKGKAAAEVASPSLYKVDLPDAKIAGMLDWDKPLSQQSKQVVKLLKKEHPGLFQEGRYSDKLTAATDLSRNYAGPISDLLQQVDNMQGVMRYGVPAEQMKGNDLWFLAMRNADRSPDKAAAVLRGKGIPGIRYLDGGSRGAGAGTSNFVVFPGEEQYLRILERNGLLAP